MNLKKEEIKKLYNATIENAQSLYDAADTIALKYEKKKFPSLGLAELALEELGKSYTLLAYYSKTEKNLNWNVFWKEWKDHNLKAHRGYFYEFFSLLRITVRNENEPLHDSFTKRGKISKEKELAFYVDIDKGSRKIQIPAEEIDDVECITRVLSIIGLMSSAFYIRDWLNSEKSENYKNAISDYTYYTLTNNVTPRDVRKILDLLKSSDVDYNEGLDEIWKLFSSFLN